MISGIIGVPFGSFLSTKWRPKEPRADPLICGFGLAISSVLLCISLFTSNLNFILTFALIFLGEVSLNLNWAIISDMLLVRPITIILSKNQYLLGVGQAHEWPNARPVRSNFCPAKGCPNMFAWSVFDTRKFCTCQSKKVLTLLPETYPIPKIFCQKTVRNSRSNTRPGPGPKNLCPTCL